MTTSLYYWTYQFGHNDHTNEVAMVAGMKGIHGPDSMVNLTPTLT